MELEYVVSRGRGLYYRWFFFFFFFEWLAYCIMKETQLLLYYERDSIIIERVKVYININIRTKR